MNILKHRLTPEEIGRAMFSGPVGSTPLIWGENVADAQFAKDWRGAVDLIREEANGHFLPEYTAILYSMAIKLETALLEAGAKRPAG